MSGMSTNKQISIFLVDDDELYLKLLVAELSNNKNYQVKTFLTGEHCLLNLAEKPDIIVLDYFLNGIEKNVLDGLETLRSIKLSHPEIFVIMLSSQDKIEVAVNCMKMQAAEYIVKSETAFARLEKAIQTMMHYKAMEKTLNWYMEKL